MRTKEQLLEIKDTFTKAFEKEFGETYVPEVVEFAVVDMRARRIRAFVENRLNHLSNKDMNGLVKLLNDKKAAKAKA